MKNKLTLAAICAVVAVAVPSTSAEVIASYNFGNAAGIDLTAQVVANNITASVFTNQAGNSTIASQTYQSFAGEFPVTDRALSVVTTRAATVPTFADAVGTSAATSSGFVQFSLTVAAGYSLQIDSISFSTGIASNNASSERAFFFVSEADTADFTSGSTVLLTNRTSFLNEALYPVATTPRTGGTLQVQTTNAAGTVVAAPSTITSPATLQSIGGTAETTQYFRFYTQSQGGNQGVILNNLVINGTVSAVPEPSTFAALAGFGALGYAAARRRRA